MGVGVGTDLGEGEEGSGGAVAGLGVGVGELFLQGVEGAVEEVSEAVGGGVELLGALLAEGAGEVAVVVSPAVEGSSVDADRGGDVGERLSGEEEGEGEFLGLG